MLKHINQEWLHKTNKILKTHITIIKELILISHQATEDSMDFKKNSESLYQIYIYNIYILYI